MLKAPVAIFLALILSSAGAFASGTQCKLSFAKEEAKSASWMSKLNSNAVLQQLLRTPQGERLRLALGLNNESQLARLLDHSDGAKLAESIQSRLDQLTEYIQQIRAGRKARGEVVSESSLSEAEVFIVKTFAERNLEIQKLDGTDVTFKDLEPLPPAQEAGKSSLDVTEKDVELDRKEKKKSIWEEMRLCRAAAPRSQERKNALRSFAVNGLTMGTMVVAGHYFSYGQKKVKFQDIGTDLLAGLASGGMKVWILNNRSASFMLRWARSIAMNTARTEIDTYVYYVQPFRSSQEKMSTDSEEHYQHTVRRAEYNLLYNYTMEFRTVALFTILQGLRCLIDSGKIKLPKWVPDAIQLGDSFLFSMIYFKGRKYFVDEKHLDGFNETVGLDGKLGY